MDSLNFAEPVLGISLVGNPGPLHFFHPETKKYFALEESEPGMALLAEGDARYFLTRNKDFEFNWPYHMQYVAVCDRDSTIDVKPGLGGVIGQPCPGTPPAR